MRISRKPRTRRYRAAALALALTGSALAAAGTGATVIGAAAPASALTIPAATSGGGGSCTLMPDQTVWCWGSNATGQLGNGGLASSMVPLKSNVPPAIDVSARQSQPRHRAEPHLRGQHDQPGLVLGLQRLRRARQRHHQPGQHRAGSGWDIQASQVSAGDQFSCAVTLARTVNCWGDNNYGELGNGTLADSSTRSR